MHSRIFLSAIFCLQTLFAAAQTVTPGRAQDENGAPVPFASVYIQELKRGVSANANGNFELKAPAGTYTCLFQCLGYETLERQLTLPRRDTLTVVMREKMYQADPVVVTPDAEDPAYRIMRRAIAKAPYYRNIVREYRSEVYMKTKLDVEQIKGIAAAALDKEQRSTLRKLSILQESVSELRFYAPDRFEQNIKSVISGSSVDLSQLGIDTEEMKFGMMRLNIYGTSPALPLAPGAFSNYHFRYEGTSQEGGAQLHKIRVTPRRRDNNLVAGYIYIVEGTWGVYSLDLEQTNPFGSIRMHQQYGDVGEGVYLPVSYHADIRISMLGAKGSGDLAGSVTYLSVERDEKIAQTPPEQHAASSMAPARQEPPATKTTLKRLQLQEQIDQLDQKGKLNNRDMQRTARLQAQVAALAQKEELAGKGEKRSLEVKQRYEITTDSLASKHDTAYWNLVRPVALMDAEALVYHKNDSIAAVNTGQDSVKRAKKAGTVLSEIIMGHSYRVDSSLRISFDGLMSISSMNFNTVDGYVYGVSGGLAKRGRNSTRWNIDAGGAWAFSRERFLWEASVGHLYNPKLRAGWKVEGGMQTTDFAGAQGIGIVNAWSSLLFRINPASFYGNNYVRVSHTIDIANGLTLYTGMEWADRHELSNHSDYSFFYRDTRTYNPNIPDNASVEADPGLVADNRAAILDVRLQYTPRRRYRMYNGQKQYLGSDWPTLTVQWKRGMSGMAGSDSDFDLLSVNLAQGFSFGYFNRLDYQAGAGKFLNGRSVAFADFKHFYANQPGVSFNRDAGAAYQLLPCYTYSTDEWYAAAHAKYSAPYILLKRIPLLQRLPLNESLYGSYLLQPDLKHYFEAGYGLDLSGALGVGVFAGFEQGRYRSWGVRLSLNISTR